MSRRPTPGPLWLFFYGRRRRGFPRLLVVLLLTAVVLGFTFGLPGGADVSRWVILLAALVVGLLVAVSLALVLLAWRRPPGRR